MLRHEHINKTLPTYLNFFHTQIYSFTANMPQCPFLNLATLSFKTEQLNKSTETCIRRYKITCLIPIQSPLCLGSCILSLLRTELPIKSCIFWNVYLWRKWRKDQGSCRMEISLCAVNKVHFPAFGSMSLVINYLQYPPFIYPTFTSTLIGLSSHSYHCHSQYL